MMNVKVVAGGFGAIMYVDNIPTCACKCFCNGEPIIAGICNDCANRYHNGIREGQIKEIQISDNV